MEDLIPLINKLQTVFKKTGMAQIKLPQIVVVGAQSSGKSSVLESLVKKSFLPRGTGIVTRCPIILQLNQIPKTEAAAASTSQDGGAQDSPPPAEEWCRFSNAMKTTDTDEYQEKIYTDFDEVRQAIEEMQVDMAGDKKGISMEPIILEVFSPNVINLTVVDLPGIVKVALEGQPDDIEEQVFDLIKKFIDNESAIILAVSAATQDIATSESLKLAKSVDPTGNRTLAVVTKLDLMDKGTDATSVLSGDIINVKLGIVGVINRSQEDLNNNTSMEDARKKEEYILQKNYPQVHGIGSPYLATRLNYLLKEHIHKNLPALIKRIAELSDKCEMELHLLGQEIAKDSNGCARLIMETTLKFVQNFREIVLLRPAAVMDDRDLFAVRLNKAFKQLREGIVIDMEDIDTVQILKSLKNTMNFEGFSSIEQVFKTIVKKEILKMERPAVACAKEVHELLSRTASKCLTDPRLPHLNSALNDVVDKLLAQQLKQVKVGIMQHIQLQAGMIFSSDKDFVQVLTTEGPKRARYEFDEGAVFGAAPTLKQNSPISFPLSTEHSALQQSDHSILYVHKLIVKYLDVVKRELSDYIPKYLMFHLAQNMIDQISDATKTATNGLEMELVVEPEDLRNKRKNKQDLLNSLRDAEKIVLDIKKQY